MSFLAELFRFLAARRKFWLAPILMMLAVFGALIVFGSGSVVAPLIYTLF
jgi:Family of unknown function (DUF5989)